MKKIFVVKNEETVEETKETRFQRFKNYVKDHKLKTAGIVVGAGALVGIGVKVFLSGDDDSASEVFETFEEEAKSFYPEVIDEEIYTELAPKISEAVLDNDINVANFEETYDLDDISKVVKVTIETIIEEKGDEVAEEIAE